MAATTYPDWLAGARITASVLNSMLPLVIVKPADESVTSSTTLQADNDLSCPVAANASYIVDMFLDYEAANGGDLKLGFTAPSGAALRATANYLSASASVAVTWNEISQANSTLSARGNGAGAANSVGLSLTGSLVVSSTAGNLALEWAQATSSGTATIVHAGSYLRLQRTA